MGANQLHYRTALCVWCVATNIEEISTYLTHESFFARTRSTSTTVSNIFRGSIVVSIPACHAGNPGSIPGLGAFLASSGQKEKAQKSDTFSICACHPCAGAMLIFSVSFQFYRMRRLLHRSGKILFPEAGCLSLKKVEEQGIDPCAFCMQSRRSTI